MSQQALAEHLGVSRGAVSNWESANGCSPSVERLSRVATLCGVSFPWLATGQGPMVVTGAESGAPSAAPTTVLCPFELHLLQAYRRAPDQLKKLLQDLALLRIIPMSRSRLGRSVG